MKYIKKPYLVEAMQYTGYNFDDIGDFTHGKVLLFKDEIMHDGKVYSGSIIGLNDNGLRNFREGNFIVRNSYNTYSIYTKEAFMAEYEEVKE